MARIYGQIRAALSAGFSVVSLRTVNRISLTMLGEGNHPHPAALLLVAEISGRVAEGWEERAISVQVANRVEADLKPSLERLLELMESESGQSQILDAMNETAKAFALTLRLGIDSDFLFGASSTPQ